MTGIIGFLDFYKMTSMYKKPAKPVRKATTTYARTKLTPSQRAEVKKIMSAQVEKKYLNATQSQLSVTGSSNITCITDGIQQGITDNTRVGDKIKLMKMYLRLFWGPGDGVDFVRFILFQWRPSDQLSGPTASDILLVGAGGGIDISSHYNHDKRSQFKIVYDKTINICGSGNSADSPDGPASRGFEIQTLLPKIPDVFFDAGSARGMNHVYALAISDSNVAPHPYIYYTLKVMYTDA